MRVVIVGGNECMERRYCDICENHGCRAKVFTKESTLKKKLGEPDLLIIFTSTVSHKMTRCATMEAQRAGARIAHVHSASASALNAALEEHCGC